MHAMRGILFTTKILRHVNTVTYNSVPNSAVKLNYNAMHKNYNKYNE